jgi:hypothetical protein
MALSAAAIIGIIFGLVLLGVIGYVVYRYTKDSKRTYIEKTDPTSQKTGACTGTTVSSKLTGLASNSDKCGYACDETKTCAGYQWDSTCSLYSTITGVDTTNTTAHCYEPSS